MSGMNVVQFPKQKQVQAVCRAFLRANPGREFDSMTATRALEAEWGIVVDWHEFAGALDILHQYGEAVIIKPGGYVGYRMKETQGYYKTPGMFTILEGGAYSASSDSPVAALLLYLYVAGLDGQDTLLDTLETILNSTQFEIHIGETVYQLNEQVRADFESAKNEYD